MKCLLSYLAPLWASALLRYHSIQCLCTLNLFQIFHFLLDSVTVKQLFSSLNNRQ